MGKYVSCLREADIFHNLANTQLEMVESICQECSYKKGQIIIEESSQGTELYVILNGEVEILAQINLRSARSKKEPAYQAIARFERGQSFGEIALVDEGLRSAAVRAAGRNTKLLAIERDKLLELCYAYPDLGFKIMYNLAVDLGQKVRSSSSHLRQALLAAKDTI